MTKKLKPAPGVTGDLAAINIQRGRDHGLASYIQFRNNFGVGSDSIPRNFMTELLSLYDDIDDVDLYVGGLLENPVAKGALGPTFSHILAKGFQ